MSSLLMSDIMYVFEAYNVIPREERTNFPSRCPIKQRKRIKFLKKEEFFVNPFLDKRSKPLTAKFNARRCPEAKIWAG